MRMMDENEGRTFFLKIKDFEKKGTSLILIPLALSFSA